LRGLDEEKPSDSLFPLSAPVIPPKDVLMSKDYHFVIIVHLT
jgi:hypothetical protein